MFRIEQFADEIATSLLNHDVTVISSSTSSGKSVCVPIIALQTLKQCKKMIVTVPTVLAAQRLSSYQQARQSDISVDYIGGGHYVQNQDDVQLTYATSGYMMMKLLDVLCQAQFGLCDIIMVDEAHVQSRDNFLLIRMLRYRQLFQLEIPKIIITSATMECKMFSELFWDTNILEYDCPPFPIQTIFLDRSLYDHLLNVHWYDEGKKGNVLIFCESANNVNGVVDMLVKHKHLDDEFDILALYSALEPNEMEVVSKRISVQDNENMKSFILVCTNIAESSVTIHNVMHVFDFRTEKVLKMNPTTRLNELVVRPISKSSMHQRRGRTGRTCPGFYYIDCSKYDYENNISDVSDSEFELTNTADTVLLFASQKTMNNNNIQDILFPTKLQIKQSIRSKLLDDEHFMISDIANMIAEYATCKDTNQNKRNRQKCEESVKELQNRFLIHPINNSVTKLGLFCPQIPLHLNYSTWIYRVVFSNEYRHEILELNELLMLDDEKEEATKSSIIPFSEYENGNDDTNVMNHEFLVFLSIIAVTSDGRNSLFYYPKEIMQGKHRRNQMVAVHQKKYYLRFKGKNDIQTALNIYFERQLVLSCDKTVDVAWCNSNSLNRATLQAIDEKYYSLYKLLHKKLHIRVRYQQQETFWNQREMFEQKVVNETKDAKSNKYKDVRKTILTTRETMFQTYCTFHTDAMEQELSVYQVLCQEFQVIYQYGVFYSMNGESMELNFKTSFLNGVVSERKDEMHYIFQYSIVGTIGNRTRRFMSYVF